MGLTVFLLKLFSVVALGDYNDVPRFVLQIWMNHSAVSSSGPLRRLRRVVAGLCRHPLEIVNAAPRCPSSTRDKQRLRLISGSPRAPGCISG